MFIGFGWGVYLCLLVWGKMYIFVDGFGVILYLYLLDWG